MYAVFIENIIKNKTRAVNNEGRYQWNSTLINL